MDHAKYFQPDTCVPGRLYFLKNNNKDSSPEFSMVRFVDYRPHPGEVIVQEGSIIKVIHRIDLYQRNGGR